MVYADGTVLCQSVAGGTGDITAVYGSDGLTGGGASGTVTLTLDSVYVDSQYVNENQGNSITAAMIASGSVGSSAIVDGSILFADIDQNGCTTGEVIKWDGAWVCTQDLDTHLSQAQVIAYVAAGGYATQDWVGTNYPGDITGVYGGDGILGGGTSGDISFTVAFSGSGSAPYAARPMP